MCNDPVMRAPFKGCEAAYSLRIAMSPGISVSAILISLRPQSLSAMSLMMKSGGGLICAFIDWVSLRVLSGRARGLYLGRQRVRFVGPLPAELFFLAAEVSVGSGFLIDGPGQI